MEGVRVVKVEDVASKVDLVVTATGNKKVITREHMEKMKSGTILANMGHANTEIDVLSLKASDITWEKVCSLPVFFFRSRALHFRSSGQV